MASTKIDGAGIAKLETLEQAQTILQSVHAVVEQMAIAQRSQTPMPALIQRLRRTATPLVGLLKGQFGTISDLAATLVLVSSRGSNEKARVRSLRELVGSIRMHLEIAQKRVIEQHTTHEGDAGGKDGD